MSNTPSTSFKGSMLMDSPSHVNVTHFLNMTPKATGPQSPLVMRNYLVILVVLILQPRIIKTTIAFQHYVNELSLITKI
jgi:hypothetical protein